MNRKPAQQNTNRNPMCRSLLFLLAGLILVVLPAACGESSTDSGFNGGNGNGGENGNGDGPGVHEVWLQNHAFSPSSMQIDAGTTVTWINKDNDTHTVTSNDGLFNATLGPEGEYEYTFSEAGSFSYHCEPHPNMTGTITVGSGGGGSQNDNGDSGGEY